MFFFLCVAFWGGCVWPRRSVQIWGRSRAVACRIREFAPVGSSATRFGKKATTRARLLLMPNVGPRPQLARRLTWTREI
ncbi:hypothetical protein FN846DRAFT_502281 [Sphaerosporella brunnea]|uniref:Secreted protein n=1 Tax=Sphaerosporella brunnea TaxID=1250544 RepID=A0A5J5EEK8_9PEZI|nr:hypothetical protein FN846DRAFT_502281 [Sphaerosporella brunnea]